MDIVFAAFILVGAYLIYELVFWFVNTVVVKAVFGERKAPTFISKIRKMGFRLSFICLLGGLGLGLLSLVSSGHFAFDYNTEFLQLSALFAIVSTALFVFGIWYKRTELNRL